MTRPHPGCWTGERYEHVCHQPSGLECVDCGQPAGTQWTRLWCPACDVKRLERISASLHEILAHFDSLKATRRERGDQ